MKVWMISACLPAACLATVSSAAVPRMEPTVGMTTPGGPTDTPRSEMAPVDMSVYLWLAP